METSRALYRRSLSSPKKERLVVVHTFNHALHHYCSSTAIEFNNKLNLLESANSIELLVHSNDELHDHANAFQKLSKSTGSRKLDLSYSSHKGPILGTPIFHFCDPFWESLCLSLKPQHWNFTECRGSPQNQWILRIFPKFRRILGDNMCKILKALGKLYTQ